ncbi:MAG: hypothetical protein OXH56_00135 [Gemmatimonadetes bacterium]|nr:hypothetical protein [Gemmatimonadota bacterium]
MNDRKYQPPQTREDFLRQDAENSAFIESMKAWETWYRHGVHHPVAEDEPPAHPVSNGTLFPDLMRDLTAATDARLIEVFPDATHQLVGEVVVCADGKACRHNCLTDREGSCYRVENCAPRPEYGPTWKFGDNAPKLISPDRRRHESG